MYFKLTVQLHLVLTKLYMYLIITSLITRIQSNIAQVYTENQVSHTNNPVYFNLPHVHVLSNLETQAYGGRSSLLWLHLTFCISRLSKHVLLLMRIFISLCTILFTIVKHIYV